ncbi:NAD(P)H-binding protein, partial [Rhizobiaceae sp. 2RAB30]
MTEAKKRVLVVGGTGFIGNAVVRRLLDAGHRVTALGRNVAAAKRSENRAFWRRLDLTEAQSPEAWLPYVEDAEIVVNASGVLQTGLTDDVDAVQTGAIVALTKAASGAGVGLFVQISAPGTGPDSSTAFMRSKGEADAYLAASPLPHVLLRPGLVVGHQAYGGTAFLRMLAAAPIILPLTHADRPISTVPVSEVAEAVLSAVEGRIAPGADFELLERRQHRLQDVVLSFRRWLGFPEPRAIVRVPAWIGRLVGLGADALGYLGWRSPLRSTAMKAIEDGVTGDPAAYETATGRVVPSLDETLRMLPSTVQERWFSSLYLAMPVLLGVLSIFWIASGLIGLARLDAAASVLSAEPGLVAKTVVAVGSVIDVA